MKEPIDDGGPAFHSITVKNGDNRNGPTHYYHRGMSLRDWFAGQCNPEMYNPKDTFFASFSRRPSTEELAKWVAAIRFMEADAMLAARKEAK